MLKRQRYKGGSVPGSLNCERSAATVELHSDTCIPHTVTWKNANQGAKGAEVAQAHHQYCEGECENSEPLNSLGLGVGIE